MTSKMVPHNFVIGHSSETYCECVNCGITPFEAVTKQLRKELSLSEINKLYESIKFDLCPMHSEIIYAKMLKDKPYCLIENIDIENK